MNGRGLSQVLGEGEAFDILNGTATTADDETTSTGDVLLQTPFEDISEIFGNSYDDLLLEPPILVTVDVFSADEPITVRVGTLRKFWRKCEYYFTVTGSNGFPHKIIIEFQDGKLYLTIEEM
jgi:hypothetical protein